MYVRGGGKGGALVDAQPPSPTHTMPPPPKKNARHVKKLHLTLLFGKETSMKSSPFFGLPLIHSPPPQKILSSAPTVCHFYVNHLMKRSASKT